MEVGAYVMNDLDVGRVMRRRDSKEPCAPGWLDSAVGSAVFT